MFRAIPHCSMTHGALIAMALAYSFQPAEPIHAAEINWRIANAGSDAIDVGQKITVQIQATFDTRLSAASFNIASTGTAGATMIARSADPAELNGLTYLSAVSQDPFEDELPHDFSGGAKREVLYDADFDGEPGGANDGIGPADDLVIESITIRADSAGVLTIRLSEMQSAHTGDDINGALFDMTGFSPCGDAVVISVGGVSVLGDFDGNGQVDLLDHASYSDCAAGPDAAPGVAETCTQRCRAAFDSDEDDDVDLRDFANVQQLIGSP